VTQSLQHPFITTVVIRTVTETEILSVGPCHNGLLLPRFADGEDRLQTWRVAAKILNNQSRIAVKGWSSRLEVGREANNSSP